VDRTLKRLALMALVGLAAASLAWPASQRRKKKADEEPPTQVLELPKDPPPAATAETRRMVFRVTPLTAKGLLSQQVREALRWLLRDRGLQPVKLRAFVAGSGDMRRVQAIVSEVFTDRRLPLPALTVVQAGALPLVGAQVIIEAVCQSARPANPGGLAFASGQTAAVEQPLQPVAPLAEKSFGALRQALGTAGLQGADVLRATCFLSSLDDVDAVRRLALTEFPNAALNFVQRLREPTQSVATCEAVARLQASPGEPLRALGGAITLVGARRLTLSGAQLAFGATGADAKLAFERLAKTLDQAGTSWARAAMVGFYPLSSSVGVLAQDTGGRYFNPAAPPALTVAPCEGLPGLDASFAVDVVAVLPDSSGQ
jgi:enamine deaminase RidA (YjgF/YER057c/UK114 family)